MERTLRTASPALMAMVLLQACSTTMDTTATRDGVYDRPSRAEAIAPVAVAQEAPAAPAAQSKAGDADYYDAAESKRYTDPRNYYDMTYNDPYYYNYGRFGFGVGMGYWGNGWGMGTGWGSPGWNDPYWGNSWQSGYGAWGPGWGYDPWGYGGYGNPYGSYGWNTGWGPYQGYYGSCWSCYQPILIVDGSGGRRNVTAHRGSLGGNSAGASGGNRAPVYDPVGLLGQPEQRPLIEHRPVRERPMEPAARPQPRPADMTRPARNDVRTRPERMERPSRPSMEPAPSRGGFDQGTRDGSFTSPAPSRSGGGRR